VIIGGGFAGLAAAVRLSERESGVLLVEARGHLGGRAYSFTDARTGDTVDNGQHLFMGCYRHTVAFLEKIGRADGLKFQDSPRIDFLDAADGYATFSCPRLPAPIHALAGLARLKGLSVADKLRALKVGRAIRRNGRAGVASLTVAEWLDRLSQSTRIKERFWYPMAIATLNESPAIASARMMKVVLERAFASDRRGSSIGIARVGLSDLYTSAATNFIRARGGLVRTAAAVNRLIIERGAVAALELKGGEMIEADYFISAVPHAALLRILPDELAASEFAPLAKLGSSPIVSINLWFDRAVLDREFVGLLGARCQWIFNKDLIFSTGRQTNQIAVVISAARDYVEMAKDRLVEMAIDELRALVPASREANLIHSQVVKEREATLSHTVESDTLRPGPRTSIPNLFLAGDWTDTGLPATIESAVLSGNIAADLV
jgi:squalene-associated FAD-dependent desaturase